MIIDPNNNRLFVITCQEGFYRPDCTGYTEKLEDAGCFRLVDCFRNWQTTGLTKNVFFKEVVVIQINQAQRIVD